MSYAEKHIVEPTTNASGVATGYTPVITGRIISIQYLKDGTIPFTDGVDFTIKTEDSGQNLWVELNVNASKTVAPRQPTHDTAGVASLYAAAGEPVEDYIYAAQERISIGIAQGGDSKKGKFIVIVG